MTYIPSFTPVHIRPAIKDRGVLPGIIGNYHLIVEVHKSKIGWLARTISHILITMDADLLEANIFSWSDNYKMELTHSNFI